MPIGSLYVLWVMGLLASPLKLVMGGMGFAIFVKIPAVLADLVVVFLIYYYQPQVAVGEEDSGPGPEDYRWDAVFMAAQGLGDLRAGGQGHVALRGDAPGQNHDIHSSSS